MDGKLNLKVYHEVEKMEWEAMKVSFVHIEKAMGFTPSIYATNFLEMLEVCC